MQALSDIRGRATEGIPFLLVTIGLSLVAAAGIVLVSFETIGGWWIVPIVIAILVATVIAAGLYTLQPNQAAVLALFGDYKGTDRTTGLRFANPLYRKSKVSLRVRNFTTETSKVNDANGNPILIAAVVVWRVTDPARAVFDVDDFEDYVRIQSESAVRHLARSYPYDAFDEDATLTLIGDTDQVNRDLLTELQERADAAGVEILEARITDLSYAPEIAEAMLRRQQAGAIVSARAKIVEGAIAMVRGAVAALDEGIGGTGPLVLDDERKAMFVSNLMTVIVSDQPTTPVVGVGTQAR